jgi:hypothetical protein
MDLSQLSDAESHSVRQHEKRLNERADAVLFHLYRLFNVRLGILVPQLYTFIIMSIDDEDVSPWIKGVGEKLVGLLFDAFPKWYDDDAVRNSFSVSFRTGDRSTYAEAGKRYPRGRREILFQIRSKIPKIQRAVDLYFNIKYNVPTTSTGNRYYLIELHQKDLPEGKTGIDIHMRTDRSTLF